MDYFSDVRKYIGITDFVPLGSWCRASWQTQAIAKVAGKQKISYPFDWAITPLDAVIKAIKNDIIIDKVLSQGEIMICPYGHVLCGHTGMRFAHDLKIKEISEKYSFPIKKGELLPDWFYSLEEVRQAKGRFAYTYKNFRDVLVKQGVAFVRFVNVSHTSASKDLCEEILSGEDPMRLLSCLRRHGAHPTSRLIYIFSETVPGVTKEIVEPVTRLKLSSRDLFSCHIYERKGLLGDQTDRFYGDAFSWLAAIKEADAWFSSF